MVSIVKDSILFNIFNRIIFIVEAWGLKWSNWVWRIFIQISFKLGKVISKVSHIWWFWSGFHLYLVHISRSSSELKLLCRVFSSRRILQNSGKCTDLSILPIPKSVKNRNKWCNHVINDTGTVICNTCKIIICVSKSSPIQNMNSISATKFNSRQP